MLFPTWIALRFSPTCSCMLSEEQKEWCVEEENASTRNICCQVCNKLSGCGGRVAFVAEYLRIEDQIFLIVWATHTNKQILSRIARIMRNFSHLQRNRMKCTSIHFGPHEQFIRVLFYIAVTRNVWPLFIHLTLLHSMVLTKPFFFLQKEAIGGCSADNWIPLTCWRYMCFSCSPVTWRKMLHLLKIY